MSQFEKSEVMVKYAELMIPQITKQAADVVDYAQAVGEAAAWELGIGAAGVAAWGGITGAGLGAATPFATGAAAALTGTAAGGGLLAILGGPVGWALGLAALGYALYQVSKQTDDNVTDLISRIEALDPKDEQAEERLAQWIQILQSYKPILGAPPPTGDSKERATYNNQKLSKLAELESYLKQLSNDWPTILDIIDDPFYERDPAQAKTAVDKTLVNISQQVVQLRAVVAKAAKAEKDKLLSQFYKQYVPVVQRMQNAIRELTTRTGGAPKTESEVEARGVKLMTQIANQNATLKDILTNWAAFVAMDRLLQLALKQTAAEKTHQPVELKASINPRPISKRALLLADGRSVTFEGAATKGPARRKGKGLAIPKNQDVMSLQGMINTLNAKYETGANQIATDGRYGPRTAEAFSILISSVPQIGQQLSKYNITAESAGNYKATNKDVKNYTNAVKVLSTFAKGKLTELDRKRTKERPSAARCREDKENMTTSEINACLKVMRVDDPVSGERVPAYSWLEKNYKQGPPSEAVYDAFVTSYGLPPYIRWDPAALVRHVLGESPRISGRTQRAGQRGPRSRDVPLKSAKSSLWIQFEAPETGNVVYLRDWLNWKGFRKESSKTSVIDEAKRQGAKTIAGLIDYINAQKRWSVF